MMMSTTKPNKRVLKARQGSFVVRPPRPPTNQVLQPKRRASFATFRPKTSSYMTASLNSSNSRLMTGHVMGRQSFAWDPQRVWHASRVQSPMPRLREGVAATVMATPIAPRNSKFVGSPPTQAGSWRPKHPTVVALQKKHLVWSPLKLRVVRNGNRKSFLPSDAQIKL